ncbi:LamG domain-containing protein [Crocinitomicaceae bacterium]|nr:LamG domain-containing protein [Crocinitomicaceae bacterium]
MKTLLLFGAIALSINAFSQAPTYVPTNGLVAWYGFNGNADDETGNGNNGTNNGATLTTDRFSNVNSAYSFDGNDIISAISNFDASNRTVSAWFNIDSYSGTQQIILNNDYPELTNGHTIFAIQGTDSLLFQSGTLVDLLAPPELATWYFVAITRDVDSTRCYLNGTLVTSYVNDVIVSITAASQSLRIGVNRFNDRYFNGKIDDIGIWNRALNECEITELYTGIQCDLGIENNTLNTPKQLLKIVDLMGRETPYKPNTVLIYVFDDGSAKKVFKMD